MEGVGWGGGDAPAVSMGRWWCQCRVVGVVVGAVVQGNGGKVRV